jgi:hypothetical protein
MLARPSGVNQQRREAPYPSANRDASGCAAAFREPFFNIAAEEPIFQVPARGQQDRIRRKPKTRKRRTIKRRGN